MAKISINDTAKAISDAQELATNAVQIDSVRESLEYILNEVKAYWEETQQDAQKFSSGLSKNVINLQSMVECNKEFANVITKYAEAQGKTAEQTVSV